MAVRSLLCACLLVACVPAMPLEDRPCPCIEGWACCARTGRCLPAGEPCEAPGGSDGGDGWGDEQVIQTVSPYCYAAMTAPGRGMEDWLVAARLTPPSYPFRVEKVLHALKHGVDSATGLVCDAGRAHELLVFAAAGAVPPPEPAGVRTVAIAAESATGSRTVETVLDEPLLLEAGHVYVALRSGGAFPEVLCFGRCPSGERGRTFLSGAGAPPYAWGDLQDNGIAGNLSAAVAGRAELP